VALFISCALYVQKSVCTAGRQFATKLALAAEVVEALPIPPTIMMIAVCDGAYARYGFVFPVVSSGRQVLSRLRSDTVFYDLPPARKKLLIIGQEKGYRHEAVSHAMVTIERLGKETGLWDTVIRTDTEALTRKKLEYNAPNLNDFDAVLFFTSGGLEMTRSRRPTFFRLCTTMGKASSECTAPALHSRSGLSTAL